jgi:D-amino peptidase
MKVVISVDIEGASGLVSTKETGEGAFDYQLARRHLTHDCNAVVEGALAAGATQIVLHDTHGYDFRNILLDELHPAAEVVRGLPVFFFEQLQPGYDACFLVAAHAGPHRTQALLSHLYTSQFQEVRFDGTPVGEGEVTAAMAGSLSIPTTLVTGDDVVCADMKAVIPDIETAVVKTSLSRYAGHCLSLERTCAILKEAAYQALQDVDRRQPFVYGGDIEVEVLCDTGHHARLYADMGRAEWDGHKLVYCTASDIWEAYRFLTLGLYLLSSRLVP